MIARDLLKQIDAKELLNYDNINQVISNMLPDKCRIYYICSIHDLEECIDSISKSLNQRKLECIRDYYNKTNVLGCAFLSQKIIIIFVKSIFVEGKYFTKDMCAKRFYNVLFHEICHLKLNDKGIDDNENIVNKFARDLCRINSDILLNPFNDEVYKNFKKEISILKSLLADIWDVILSTPFLFVSLLFLVYRVFTLYA